MKLSVVGVVVCALASVASAGSFRGGTIGWQVRDLAAPRTIEMTITTFWDEPANDVTTVDVAFGDGTTSGPLTSEVTTPGTTRARGEAFRRTAGTTVNASLDVSPDDTPTELVVPTTSATLSADGTPSWTPGDTDAGSYQLAYVLAGSGQQSAGCAVALHASRWTTPCEDTNTAYGFECACDLGSTRRRAPGSRAC